MKKKNWKYLFSSILQAGLFLSTLGVSAKDIYVNNLSGTDDNSGGKKREAFKTFQKAVSKAQPGDVIHLANTNIPYKEMLFFSSRSGTENERITVEGNGAVISGSEPLDIPQWQEVSPGLYKNSVLYVQRRFNIDVVNRYFFLFDGKMNRMNRCLKGKNQPFKIPSTLNENEWTFSGDDNSFYIKINPDKKLSDCNIEHPVRPTGVEIAGTSSYLTIKDLVCTHFYNDGFGITNTANHLKFKNIKTLYCGDDGISAHAACQYEVDGFVSIGNGTGICDTGNSMTSYNRVFIKDCVGVDLYYINEKPDGISKYTIRNSIIICNAARPVVLITEKPGAEMSVTMENVLVIGKMNSDADVRVAGKTKLLIRNCTFMNLDFIINADSMSVQKSILSGMKNVMTKYSQTIWNAKENVYGLDHFNFNNKPYSIVNRTYEVYKSQSADTLSVWVKEISSRDLKKFEGNKIGANLSVLYSKKEMLNRYFREARN